MQEKIWVGNHQIEILRILGSRGSLKFKDMKTLLGWELVNARYRWGKVALLKHLEKVGFIESEEEKDNRKVYEITEQGKRFLKDWLREKYKKGV